MLDPDETCEQIESDVLRVVQWLLLIPATVCGLLAWMYLA